MAGKFRSPSRTLGSRPSFIIACCAAPFGNPILIIFRYLEYFGSSFSGIFDSEEAGSLGLPSIMFGSSPSFTIACLTAGKGIPILIILKYFEYFGSSFRGKPFADKDSVSDRGAGLLKSPSRILGSTSSFNIACFTAGKGIPTLSILKYFANMGSFLSASGWLLTSAKLFDCKVCNLSLSSLSSSLFALALILERTDAIGERLCEFFILSASL
mmetsp:Transcript_10995/g.14350  ORF Transcript_10995/g.14350 Transcript_10995/m.14350 type:complete len:213 (+) Transcript_10995:2014-2652(+)